MENSSSLTCILCNELVPAKEHTHDCKDGNYTKIEKLVLPSGSPDTFSIVGHIPMKRTCKICNEQECSIIKLVRKTGEYTPTPTCQKCEIERAEEAAEIARKNREQAHAYAIAYRKAMEETLNLIESDDENENSVQILQCEYCGESFELGPDDFLAHQEFCKNK